MTEQQAGPAKPPYPQEPNVHSGGKQEPGSDRDLPPYEDRQKTGSGGDKEAPLEGKGTGISEAAPREVSQAEREGVSATDTTAASPLGAGVSKGNRGENLAPGSEKAHRKDQLDHGVGGRPENIDPESPVIQPGDQGG